MNNSFNSSTIGYASFESEPFDILPFPLMLDSTCDAHLSYESSRDSTDATYVPYDPSYDHVLPSWSLNEPVPAYPAPPMYPHSGMSPDGPALTHVYQDSSDHMLPASGVVHQAEFDPSMHPIAYPFPSQMYTHDSAYDMSEWTFPPELYTFYPSTSVYETSDSSFPLAVYASEGPAAPSNSFDITPPIEFSFPVQTSSPHEDSDPPAYHTLEPRSAWAPSSVGYFSAAQLEHAFMSVTPPWRIRKPPARESIKSVRRRNELLNKALLLHKRDMRILKESLANVNDFIIDIRRKLRV
jgi:hypothetical protein